MSSEHKELSKPGTIQDDAVAQEMIRFWISNNQDHVSLMISSSGDPEKEPPMWGFMLADIAKHVTRVLREQNPDGPSAQEIMEQILGGIGERLRHVPNLSGTTIKGKS